MRRDLPYSLSSLPLNTQVSPGEDPLSEVIEYLSLESWLPGPFELTAPWGIQVSNGLGWFYLIRSGECRIEIEDQETPSPAVAGDFLILSPGRQHTLRDCPSSPASSIETILRQSHFDKPDTLRHGGGGAPTCLSCGCFALSGLEQSPLGRALPPLIHIPGRWGSPQPYVDYILRLAIQEAASPEPCARTIINRLVRILLTKALHNFIQTSPECKQNWLSAIRDPDIGQAIRIMHANPEINWTVATLAERVALSRSVFSGRFTTLVGKPPLEYLTELRMQKACRLLRSTRTELKEVAARVGYESAAAFSKAFSRRIGTSPGNYRRLGAGLARCTQTRMPLINGLLPAHERAETVACTASAPKTL